MFISILIERRSALGARKSIESLIRLSPSTARRIDDSGKEEEVEISLLRVGDRVRVRPGDNIPGDGTVLVGQGTVDQASITGESLPADKNVGDEVFAGTINQTGLLEVEIKKIGEATALGQVKRLILQAEETRTPVMRLIDLHAGWYVLLILMMAGSVLFFSRDIQRAVAMLVIACPCAIVMSGPTATVAALSAAARLGLLIKNVSDLEVARRLTAVVFDKTGTLTTCNLYVARIEPAEGQTQEDLLAVHTRLGRIVGEPGQEIVEPGGPYFAFPSPVDEVRRAPTSMQEVVLQDSFWFKEDPGESDLPLEKKSQVSALTPGVHGSLLTGDKNIVHARWSASFRIEWHKDNGRSNALNFFRHVGSMERARVMLSEALEKAIVRVVGRTDVNSFYKGDIDTEAILKLTQAEMDELQTGLSVTAVSLKDRTVPLATLRDFQAAGQAESEKSQKIEEATQERMRILNGAAGAGYDKLLAVLDIYEGTRDKGDESAVKMAEAAIDDLILSDEVCGFVTFAGEFMITVAFLGHTPQPSF